MKAAPLLAAGALMASSVPMARQGVTGHMAAHMIAVALAAPLLPVGLRATACDPTRLAPPFASALAMMVLELAVVWSWHLPAVRAAVGHDEALHLLELACFLIVGTLLWSAVLAPGTSSRPAGIGALLLTSMHMTLLGALIGLAPRTLYPTLAHAPFAGLSPLQDQQLAGVVMLLIGGLSYLVGALAILRQLLGDEGEAA
ncbi:putative membrane protein [Novosphingobium chloroacetimidivorans]|uniref:Putative membrane protein n=1 Tax=Novosphingobium chloroacetimidivorans TaxID=1428314 RepID=A0A7W7K8S4_9SPHN|nr:cytochrome c oxidase assembly protein [Novosphingobium chloroacetimidivorans]MBB4858347.1 putative membrane protein [Novosphingobium chloroacetimidivorans]